MMWLLFSDTPAISMYTEKCVSNLKSELKANQQIIDLLDAASKVSRERDNRHIETIHDLKNENITLKAELNASKGNLVTQLHKHSTIIQQYEQLMKEKLQERSELKLKCFNETMQILTDCMNEKQCMTGDNVNPVSMKSTSFQVKQEQELSSDHPLTKRPIAIETNSIEKSRIKRPRVSIVSTGVSESSRGWIRQFFYAIKRTQYVHVRWRKKSLLQIVNQCN